MSDLEFVVDIIQQPYTIQIICLLGQSIATYRSIRHLLKNKDQYPIKQNTNILTILIILSFLICNIIMLCSRFIIESQLTSSEFFSEICCFWHFQTIKNLSYIHLFFSEMLIPAISLKMFRVSIAYYSFLQKNWIINIMKQRKFLLAGVLIWAGVWTLAEIFSDQIVLPAMDYEVSKYGGLQLYQFFCAKYPSNLPDQVWIIQASKTGLTLIIYITQYYFAGVLPQNYNFKWQYNSQFIIYMLPLIARNILDLNSISNLLPWYHTQFFMYYLSTLTIAWYHREIKATPINVNPSLSELQQIRTDNMSQPMQYFQRTEFRKVFFLYLCKHRRKPIYPFINIFYKQINELRNISNERSSIQSPNQNRDLASSGRVMKVSDLKEKLFGLYEDLEKFQKKYSNVLLKNSIYQQSISMRDHFYRYIWRLDQCWTRFNTILEKKISNKLRVNSQLSSTFIELSQTEAELIKQYQTYHRQFLIEQLRMFAADSIFKNYYKLAKETKISSAIILERLNIHIKTKI